MKKAILITIIVVVIVALIVGGIFATVFITVAQPKDPITVDEFKSALQQKDYSIYDAKDQYAVYTYIQSAQIAIKTDDSHQIEFYKFADSSYATNFFNNNVNIFENSKGTSDVQSTLSGTNYSKYVSKSKGKYRVVSIIEDTGIFVEVDEEYEEEVKSILEELGY